MFKRLETEMRVKAVNQIGMAESSQAQILEHQKSQYSLGEHEMAERHFQRKSNLRL
jgi:hypothetical protein